MAIIDEHEIEGTSPAGKTTRTLRVSIADDGRVVVALYSSKRQFLGDCWLEPGDTRELHSTTGWASTHAAVDARAERMKAGEA